MPKGNRESDRGAVTVRYRGPSRGVPSGGLAGLLVCTFLLSACSGSGTDTTTATPTFTDAAASTTPSTSAVPTPIMTSYGSVDEQMKTLPKDREGISTGAVMGRAVAASGEESAVAEAWLRYWQVRFEGQMVPKIDYRAIKTVSVGNAAADIVDEIKNLQKKKMFTSGMITLNPTRIIVKGSTAKVLDCLIDESKTIDANGAVRGGGVKFIGSRALMKKTQDGWVSVSLTRNDELCTNEGMEQG